MQEVVPTKPCAIQSHKFMPYFPSVLRESNSRKRRCEAKTDEPARKIRLLSSCQQPCVDARNMRSLPHKRPRDSEESSQENYCPSTENSRQPRKRIRFDHTTQQRSKHKMVIFIKSKLMQNRAI